jgi:hypothetical protein
MQILHRFAGSVQQYIEQLADPDGFRPDHCPQCRTKHPLTAHGFYTRTIIDTAFNGVIPVRRYLCQACKRTVSLLPEFALPYLRSSLTVIALFLIARLLRELKSLMHERRPVLLKVDVEGAEPEVMRSLTPLITTIWPDIVLEVLPRTVEDLNQIPLLREGYQIHHLTSAGPVARESFLAGAERDYALTPRHSTAA